MKTAVEWLVERYNANSGYLTKSEINSAKKMEEEQAHQYSEFAILNDRSGNPIIPFIEFINIDNL
jgi:hypothetical protein